MTVPTGVHVAVCDLHARYSIALDRRELEPLVRCFTDEAVLRVGGVDVAAGGRAIATRLVERAPAGIVHSVSTMTVDDGTETSGCWRSRAYFQLHDARAGRLTGLGTYDDVITVVDGEARYLVRDVNYLWRSTHDT